MSLPHTSWLQPGQGLCGQRLVLEGERKQSNVQPRVISQGPQALPRSHSPHGPSASVGRVTSSSAFQGLPTSLRPWEPALIIGAHQGDCLGPPIEVTKPRPLLPSVSTRPGDCSK